MYPGENLGTIIDVLFICFPGQENSTGSSGEGGGVLKALVVPAEHPST